MLAGNGVLSVTDAVLLLAIATWHSEGEEQVNVENVIPFGKVTINWANAEWLIVGVNMKV